MSKRTSAGRGRTRLPLPNSLRDSAKRIYVARKYGVRLGRGVRVSRNTFLEGRSVVGSYCNISDSYIGFGTYIAESSRVCSAKVGRFCSIGRGVSTGAGIHPTRDFVSTHPSFFSPKGQAGFSFTECTLFPEHTYAVEAESGHIAYQVAIGNDVWIGHDAHVLVGVTIADGAVVGLGAIVTADLQPYSINVGNPAKPIAYRFSAAQIEFLLAFQWWQKPFHWIEANAALFTDIEFFMSHVPPEC